MKHLKTYKLFESVDSDLEDIEDIMNDISDYEDIGIYFEEDQERIKINIYPECISEFFKVNQNIKSVIQRLNHLYKNDYTLLYKYMDGVKWTNFYVYDDERGLRDSNTRLDSPGNLSNNFDFPVPKIYKMQIVMIK
jgi:phage/plasmid-associated DNA primase